MNELAKCLMQFFQFSVGIIFCFQLSELRFKLLLGFHFLSIKFLAKLKSDSIETYDQAMCLQNSAQNQAIMKPTKCSALSQSGTSNFTVRPIRIK